MERHPTPTAVSTPHQRPRRRLAAHASRPPSPGRSEPGPEAGLLPRWLQEQLYGRFYLGRLQAGDRMPGVRQLARELNVSPTTVHQLYGRLQEEGILETRERSGTFVRTLGRQLERGGQEAVLFRAVADMLGRLDLSGASPERLADLFQLAAGLSQRDDFAFGLLAVSETRELVAREISRRLKARPRLVNLSPAQHDRGEVRLALRSDPQISCLVTTCSNSTLAFDLAAAYDLYVIFVQLTPATAQLFEPPAAGTRYVLSRDRETAEGFTNLIGQLLQPPLTDRFAFADLGDEAALARFALEAEEVWATEPAAAGARLRFPPPTVVRVVPFSLTKGTVHDLLFHYLFAAGRWSRRAPRLA